MSAQFSCKCAKDTWVQGTIVPAVCGEFTRREVEGFCAVCEHDEACHGLLDHVRDEIAKLGSE